MINNFRKELQGVEFDFHTMNTIRLQLFQVFVMDENLRKRFHMQVDGNGAFYITDKEKCPSKYLSLETSLSDAILEH